MLRMNTYIKMKNNVIKMRKRLHLKMTSSKWQIFFNVVFILNIFTSAPCLSSCLFPSSFVVCLSSYTQRGQFLLLKALVHYCFLVFHCIVSALPHICLKSQSFQVQCLVLQVQCLSPSSPVPKSFRSCV